MELRALLPQWAKAAIRPLSSEYFGIPPARIGTLTWHLRRLNRRAASRVSVEADVHPADFIYWFLQGNTSRTSAASAMRYFETGAESAQQLLEIVRPLKMPQPIRLLEFACGYGCVSRHLKRLSEFDLVCCDIHREALAFLSEKLLVQTLPSDSVPERFATRSFDVVFALSFFSHMPRDTFARWLRALYGATASGGHLIFTTHGMKSHEAMGSPALSEDGFYFKPSSEQHDLDGAEYGMTFTTPAFVRAALAQAVGVEPIRHSPAFWWGHQDLWVVKKAR